MALAHDRLLRGRTQEALRRHPIELDEDSVWELSVADGLERE